MNPIFNGDMVNHQKIRIILILRVIIKSKKSRVQFVYELVESKILIIVIGVRGNDEVYKLNEQGKVYTSYLFKFLFYS